MSYNQSFHNLHREWPQSDQNAYNQKVSINNTLYAQFGKNIKDALVKLAEAEEHITTECPLVAENYEEDIKLLQDQINLLQDDLDAQYKNLALSEESEYDTNDIISKIESLIAEADKAQEIESSVESITYTDKGNAIYTLSGVRVSTSEAKKGIFIVNGKIRIF